MQDSAMHGFLLDKNAKLCQLCTQFKQFHYAPEVHNCQNIQTIQSISQDIIVRIFKQFNLSPGT